MIPTQTPATTGQTVYLLHLDLKLAHAVHSFIVKQWMGHKSLAMTDYYSHVGVDQEENAMAKLEGKMA